MKKIFYKSEYADKAEGILLAIFDLENETYEFERKFIFRKSVKKKCIKKYYMVFTPYKHRMKDIELISSENVLSEPQFDESLHIVKASRFVLDDPDNDLSVTVIDFTGCDFILENDLIFSVCYGYTYPALECLYKNIPEIINEVFDDEQ